MYLYFILIICLLFVTLIEQYFVKQKLQYKCVLVNRKKDIYYNLIFLFLFLIILMLFCFRNKNVGTDTRAYFEIYQDFQNRHSKFSNEPVFYVINMICSILNLDFVVLLTFVGLLQMVGMFVLIKKYSSLPLFSILLYVTLGIMGMTYNFMRQMMAVGFFAFAINFLIKNNTWGYFCAIILASLCHASALILVPVYFIKKLKLGKYIYIITAPVIMGSIVFLPIIAKTFSKVISNDYYSTYIKANLFRSSINFYSIAYLFGLIAVLVWFIFVRNRIKKNSKDIQVYNIFLWLFYINVCIRIIATFSSYFQLVGRFTMYFFWSIIILIPYALKYENRLERKYGLSQIIQFACVIYFLFSAVLRNTNKIYPYELCYDIGSFNWFMVQSEILILITIILNFAVLIYSKCNNFYSEFNYSKKYFIRRRNGLN